jgi:Fe(3+) dicitrate transport protein
MRRASAIGILIALTMPASAFAQPPPAEAAPAPPAETEPVPPPLPPPANLVPPPAPEPPPPRPEPVEVRVIGSKPDSLQRIPGSGTVITQKEIQRANPQDVGEMLRRVPGLEVRQENGGGLRMDVGIHGLDPGRSRHVLILEDGVPVSLNPYAEPDMYYGPPIERMRGIEVVKGSGSILFGPQTIGGVINFLTLTPEDRQHAVVDAEGGTLGYMRGLASYNDTFGGARYVIQAFHKRGDGFRSEAFNSTDVFGKMAFDTSERGEATVKLGFHDDSTDSDDVGLTRAMYQANPGQPTLAPYDHLYLRRYEASLIHEQRFSDTTKLRTLVYGYITDRIWRRQDYLRCPSNVQQADGSEQTFSCDALMPAGGYDRVVGDPRFPSAAIAFATTDTVLDRDYQVAGVEPRLEHRAETGPLGHTFDLGARLLGETAHYQQRTGSRPTTYAGTLDFEERHRTIAFAGYLQDRIAFRDNLLVTPGVRLEHAEFHRLVTRQADQDVFSAGDSSVTGVIPGIGMIAGTRRAHVFAGLHVGWAPPRIVDAISPKGVPQQVSAEQSINYEVGARVTPTKWLHVEGTGFLTNYQNQVVVNTTAMALSNPLAAESVLNAGNTRHIGVELAGVWGVGKLLGWRPAVDVGLRYTFVRATFVDQPYAGNLLPYAPEHNLNMNLDVEDESGLGGQIAYLHVSEQYTDGPNTVAEDTTGRVGLMPAYNVLDLNAHYRHKPTGLTLRVTVKNALDDLYITARRPEGIFVSGFRLVMVGLRWDYDGKKREP